MSKKNRCRCCKKSSREVLCPACYDSISDDMLAARAAAASFRYFLSTFWFLAKPMIKGAAWLFFFAYHQMVMQLEELWDFAKEIFWARPLMFALYFGATVALLLAVVWLGANLEAQGLVLPPVMG